jgi:hypothetical protein
MQSNKICTVFLKAGAPSCVKVRLHSLLCQARMVTGIVRINPNLHCSRQAQRAATGVVVTAGMTTETQILFLLCANLRHLRTRSVLSISFEQNFWLSTFKLCKGSGEVNGQIDEFTNSVHDVIDVQLQKLHRISK